MTTAPRRRGGLQITITTNVMVTTTRTLSKSMPPFPLSSAAQHTFPMAGDEERRTRETERESDGSENEAMFAASACPISTNRGSGSWQTPLSSHCHTTASATKNSGAPSLLLVDRRGSTLEVSVGYSKTLSVATSAGLIVAQFMGMNCSHTIPSRAVSVAFQ
ncbi:hypothetical protein BHE74_00049089 [Ensete ventricosum]|nr:hypothetical protein BHE74_00049089 [Ensete ventricosum]